MHYSCVYENGKKKKKIDEFSIVRPVIWIALLTSMRDISWGYKLVRNEIMECKVAV